MSLTKKIAVVVCVTVLCASCGFKRKKYENPIAKDTQQPDKVLFDKAVNDIEHSRFEMARLTLNTLINTYDQSEYLAKAKLAIADSWYREGGTHGLAQAEAEYKDFILFYPTMEEAAESQEKICMIHYTQMDMPDRDPNNALRAEQECRTLLTQFPNSKFAPIAQQRLREIQEVLADAEFSVGDMYHHKGSNSAAANRLSALVDQYPLYSKADLSLWEEADSYSKMGPRFRAKEGDALAKLVREYPLSPWADPAKKKLESLEIPIPEADPAAVAHMKYEKENRTKPGMIHRGVDLVRGRPDTSMAAKSGSPTMVNPKGSIPASVPVPAGTPGVTDVTAAPVTDPTALDTKPDARLNPPGSPAAKGTPTDAVSGTTTPASATTPANGKPAADSGPAPDARTQAAADAKAKVKKTKKKKSTDKTDQPKPVTNPQPQQ
jgi:outer membrane protein assembly factor BamD